MRHSRTARFALCAVWIALWTTLLVPPGTYARDPVQFFQFSRSARLFEKGVEHYNAGRYYSALDIFRRLMNYPPEKNARLTASTLMTMKSYFHAGRPEEAMDVGRSFLIRFPKSSYGDDVYECFGDIFVTKGRYRSALESYLQARKKAEGDSALYRIDDKLAHLAGGLLNEEEIRDLLAVEADTSSRSILTLMLANRFLASGKVDEAALTLFRMEVESIPLSFMDDYAALKQRTYHGERRVAIIGAVLPLSGYDQTYGTSFLRGMQEAVQTVRERQPVEIVLEVMDNAGEDITTVSCMKTLMANPNVVAIVGPLSTPNSVTAAAAASQNNIPVLIPLSTQVGLIDIGSNVFQMTVDLVNQGRYAAEYAVSAMGLRALAVVTPADYFGKQLTDGFVQRADELGAEIVAVEWYTGVPVDLRAQFSSLRKTAFGLTDLRSGPGSLSLELDTADNTFFISERDFFPEREVRVSSLSSIDSSRVVLNGIEGIYFPIHRGDINYVASQFSSYYLDTQLLGNANWYDAQELGQEMIGPNIDGIVILSDHVNPWDRKKGEIPSDELLLEEGDDHRMALFGYDIMTFLAGQIGDQPSRASVLENLKGAESFRGRGKIFSFTENRERVNTSLYVLSYQNGGFITVGEFNSDSLLTHTVQSP
ncbi:MAG: penicillin-binding protein activator [Fidelibacterota bacterium]